MLNLGILLIGYRFYCPGFRLASSRLLKSQTLVAETNRENLPKKIVLCYWESNSQAFYVNQHPEIFRSFADKSF